MKLPVIHKFLNHKIYGTFKRTQCENVAQDLPPCTVYTVTADLLVTPLS